MKRWSKEEITFLTDNYAIMSYTKLAQALGRSRTSVAMKVEKLGLLKGRYGASGRPWEPEEIAFVKENYGRRPVEEIAARLNRTGSAVYGLVNRIREEQPRDYKLYSEEERRYVAKAIKSMPPSEIARKLGRSRSSVMSYLHRAKLDRPAYKPIYTDEELLSFLARYIKMTGRAPTLNNVGWSDPRLRRKGLPSPAPFYNRFGSMTEAVKLARKWMEEQESEA